MNKISTFLLKHKKYIGFGLVLAVGLFVAAYLVNFFLDLVEELKHRDLAAFDDAVAKFIAQIRNEPLTAYFKQITIMGDVQFYLIALPIIALIIYKTNGRWGTTIKTAVILVIAAGINFLLKDFIERKRPDGKHLVSVDSSSFPSGHTVSSVAFYGFLIYVVWRSTFNMPVKITLTIILLFIILNVGFSRIYLGVHHATDVVAGIIVGAFFLLIFIMASYTSHFLNHNTPEKKS